LFGRAVCWRDPQHGVVEYFYCHADRPMFDRRISPAVNVPLSVLPLRLFP
jgi:hypothetical protein